MTNIGLDLLDQDRILADLSDTARLWLSRLEVHSVLDSTNNYLLARVAEDWPSGAVCLAEQQQAGRGRQGRSWLSPLPLGWLLRYFGAFR
ncbi:MAG: hypothetical protein HC889_14855 [Synechococcaceae cyanobacterium SM1_2_3]|nr:hypothetical protein [Synechococcaceae cyanobacterium SM1_2_3]